MFLFLITFVSLVFGKIAFVIRHQKFDGIDTINLFGLKDQMKFLENFPQLHNYHL